MEDTLQSDCETDASADIASPCCSEEKIHDREFVSLLLTLYRDSPTLWNVKCKDYMNKNKRLRELVKITKQLQVYKPWFTVEKLKRKINTLRTNFNKQKNKLESTRKSIDSTGEDPVPTLWYFNQMLFLTDQYNVSDKETSEPLAIDSNWPIHEVKVEPKQKVYKITSSENLVDTPTIYFQETIKRHQSESDVIAKSWAMKLKRLAPEQKRCAEKIINDVLFEGALGSLTRNGVSFL